MSRRLLTSLLSIALIASALPLIGMNGQAVAGQGWVFIAYMSADVAASPLNWSQDLNEMEAGLLNQSIEIIALVDPVGENNSVAYRIAHDETDAIASGTVGYALPGGALEALMGDSETLTTFGEYVIDNYYVGGDRVGVILWGHGDGWTGVCRDKDDYLNPHEMGDALGNISDALGKKISLVAFDACSMGSMEVLSTLSGAAEYSISSEIPMPDIGFPYNSIFSDLSENTSVSTTDAGSYFVDEYVAFSLVTGLTQQAAMVDLGNLAALTQTFIEYAEESTRSIPIMNDSFSVARNYSSETDGISTVDMRHYISQLAAVSTLPARLWMLGREIAMDHWYNATIFNRAFIIPADRPKYMGSGLYGISLFFPIAPVAMDEYRNVSDASESWGRFLQELYSNESYSNPEPEIAFSTEDLYHQDGQPESVILGWNSTPEIVRWEFDLLKDEDLAVERLISALDDNLSASFDDVSPGFYALGMYGIDANGSYRYYNYSTNVTSYLAISVALSFPFDVDAAKLNLTDARTGMTSTLNVSGNGTIAELVVPEPYMIGDMIIVELVRDGNVVANGSFVIGETVALSLTKSTDDYAYTAFLFFFLGCVVVGFLLIKLRRGGEREQRQRGGGDGERAIDSEQDKEKKD